MGQLFNQKKFSITINKSFKEVITHCATIHRDGQQGTWITDNMIASYLKLHQLGFAISVEVWKENKLAGGLYGIDLKNGMFCGESMFALESNASKYGFIDFIRNSNFKIIDCQIHTSHLESLGADFLSREKFLRYL